MARPVVAFTVTFYTSVDEVRCALALRLCEVAAECQIPLVVVDASPDPAVPAAMIERGATVHPQQSKGKKGAALREAISRALPLAAPKGVLLWLEPEKVDMLRHAAVTARPIIQRDAEIVIPSRNSALFQSTYPLEQWHSESFGNASANIGSRAAGMGAFDWFFGPFAFRADLSEFWLQCTAELWDAQMVPILRAHAAKGARVTAVEVPYAHPPEQKRAEEGSGVWAEKRLQQLQYLLPLLKQEFEAAREQKELCNTESPER